MHVYFVLLLIRWHSGEESSCQCRRYERCRFNPWVRKIPWRRKQKPTPVFLPVKPHGQRSLAGYSPWGHKKSNTTERLSTLINSEICSIISSNLLLLV